MANKKGWGGSRKGAGRPKAGDLLKIRKLLDESIDPALVIEKLWERIEAGDHRAIELYLKYRAGLPKQEMDINLDAEVQQEFKLSDLVRFKGQK